MERHTECFLCISIFVILLPNIARPEDCVKVYTNSRGQLDTLFHTVAVGDAVTPLCQFIFRAPVNHYVLLNITRLIGFTADPHRHSQSQHQRQPPLPRLVAVVASRERTRRLGSSSSSGRTICSSQSEPLPLVVQSDSSKLRLVFYGSSSGSSGFSATYTFHTRQVAEPPNSSLPVRYPRDTTRTANSTETSASHRTPPVPEPVGPSDNSLKLLEFFVLLIVTPVAVFCMCAIIVYHCRKQSSCSHSATMSGHSSGRATSQSDVTTVASNSPLLSSSTSTFSAQQNQDMLRQQRLEVCRRSPSTEKYPVSIPLPDEDEPPYLRGQRLNLDPPREGVRGPPNRTVYDSDMYNIDSYHIEQMKQKPKTPTADSKKTEPVRTRCHHTPALSRGLITRSSEYIIVDSVTRTPVDMADYCDEPPPPYSSVVSPLRGSGLRSAPTVNNNSVNVCESLNTTATTTAAVRGVNSGRGARTERWFPSRGHPPLEQNRSGSTPHLDHSPGRSPSCS